MAMSGCDLVTLAALLGHSRIQMVMRYAHPVKQHKIMQSENYNKCEQAEKQHKKQKAATFSATVISARILLQK
jgi:hypothetical protein